MRPSSSLLGIGFLSLLVGPLAAQEPAAPPETEIAEIRTEEGDGAGAEVVDTEASVTAAPPQDAMEATSEAPNCPDREAVLTALDEEVNEVSVGLVNGCFELFALQVRQLSEATQEELLDEYAGQAGFRFSVLQRFSRLFEAGGTVDRELQRMEREIQSVRESIEAYEGNDEAQERQSAALIELEQRYKTELQLITEYRSRIAEETRGLLAQTPVIVNDIRLQRMDEAIATLETANEGLSAVLSEYVQDAGREGN